MAKQPRWSAEEIERLRAYADRLMRGEMSAKDIAAAMGRSRNGVVLALYRKLHVNWGKFTTQQQIEMVKTYYTSTPDLEFSVSELCEKSGLSRGVVTRIASRLGVTNIRRKKHASQYGFHPERQITRPLKCLDTYRQRARSQYDVSEKVCEECCTFPVERHHKDGDPRNNSPSNIAFLCRRCHMVADGRLANLIKRAKSPRIPVQPRPCIICQRPYKPLRKGRCHNCNEYRRRHGHDKHGEKRAC